MDAPAIKVGGSLRKNPRKEKESQADLVGKWTDHTGKQYWLSAWRNVGNDGNVYFSLKLGAAVEQQSQGGYQPRQAAPAQARVPAPPPMKLKDQVGFADMDDDIPFN
jgi:hypothetical protein